MISPDMVSAIKVRFLKSIFEDDFTEKGMIAWLTDIQWSSTCHCYVLFFDFTEFEEENDKYFKASYFPNSRTKEIAYKTGRELFTAKESGEYYPKYSVYFSVSTDSQDDELFAEEIKKFLQELTS
jgi:hypothetical protein